MAVTMYKTTVGAGVGEIGEVLQTEWLNRVFLNELVPAVILYRYGTHPDMPLSTSNKARWLLFDRIAADNDPAGTAEGAEPTAARTTNVNAYDATILELADFIEVSSLLDLTSISGTTMKLGKLLAQLAAEQVDNHISNTLDAHALAADADISDGSINDDGTFDTDELFKADSLRRIAKKLVSAFARPHPMAVTGRKFVLVASPRIFYEFLGDVQALGAAASVTRRLMLGTSLDRERLEKGFFDSGEVDPGMFGVEVVLNMSARIVSRTINAAATNTQNNFAFADEAFGLVDLNANLAQPAVITRVPGPQTVSQPTGAKSTMGFRIPFAATLFNAGTMVVFGSV